jgi:hypothetical protein
VAKRIPLHHVQLAKRIQKARGGMASEFIYLCSMGWVKEKEQEQEEEGEGRRDRTGEGRGRMKITRKEFKGSFSRKYFNF